MPTINISDPTADSTVGWQFTASGGYDTAPTARSDSQLTGSIACTLYDSGGGQIQVHTFRLPSQPPAGTWSVPFSVDQDYTGCTLTAVLYLSGSPAASDSVSPLDISGSKR
jgi:hypothetical protein